MHDLKTIRDMNRTRADYEAILSLMHWQHLLALAIFDGGGRKQETVERYQAYRDEAFEQVFGFPFTDLFDRIENAASEEEAS